MRNNVFFKGLKYIYKNILFHIAQELDLVRLSFLLEHL